MCCMVRPAGDFPGAGDAVRRSAAQQLQQQVSLATAPAIMALARQQNNQALQDRCVEVMSAHRKNDVYGVLDFALRFNLRSLQGSCLGSICRQSRDRLVDKADRIMQVSLGEVCHINAHPGLWSHGQASSRCRLDGAVHAMQCE